MIFLELRCTCGNLSTLSVKSSGYKEYTTHDPDNIREGFYLVDPTMRYICCNCGKDMTLHVVKETSEIVRADIDLI